MGVTSTKSGRLEVNLSLFEKRGEKSHLETILLSAVSGIWRFCMVIRLLLPVSLETRHDPKEPVLLIALKIMRLPVTAHPFTSASYPFVPFGIPYTATGGHSGPQQSYLAMQSKGD